MFQYYITLSGMHLSSRTVMEDGVGEDILTYGAKSAWNKKKEVEYHCFMYFTYNSPL